MLIPDKESLSVEFKSVPKSGLSDSAILDTVIGMTNTYGGILYIGVDNDGTISGIPAESKWANPTKVSAFVADNTVPLLFVECERHNIDNKIVVLRASMKMERTSVEPSRLTTLDFSENGTTA